MIRGVSIFVAALAVVAPAQAGDKPKLFGGSKEKAPKIYPALESRYIKQFAGPTVSCGACFGFYHTQWRSWAEACGEPQPVDPGPKQYAPPPGTVIPEPEKTGTPPAVPKLETGPDKKDPPKKEPEQKEPEKKDPPKEKTSIVLPPIEAKPAQLPGTFEIVLPAAPPVPAKPVSLPAPAPTAALAPIPALPAPALIPTVIIPISGK